MDTLEKSLLANALFSGLTGIILVFFYRPIGQLFEVPSHTAFWTIGYLLLFFAATIVYTWIRPHKSVILFISSLDVVWVLASIAVLVVDPFEISTSGHLIIAGVALIVAILAILQILSLYHPNDISGPKERQLTYERIFHAGKDEVWEVVSDISNYHLYAPNIDRVQILSGKKQGVGVERQCHSGNHSWTELCESWEEGRHFAFRVNTSAPDYPYPFKGMKGHWMIEAIDHKTTKLTLRFELRYKRGYQFYILHPFLKKRFETVVKRLLDNWQHDIGN